VLYRIFTLHPEIFESFTNHSLVARGISKEIIQFEFCNWRDSFGVGNYHQVDDRPFGGGTGMVLMVDPVFKALEKFDAVSKLFKQPPANTTSVLPNNSSFYQIVRQSNQFTKATIMLTPRGFTLNQEVADWLASFQELNILCGRYEGFDARLNSAVDLEISMGSYVLNGGEVAAMSLVESTARLVPGFVTKSLSIEHDSFTKDVNQYKENQEFVLGKRNIVAKHVFQKPTEKFQNLFDDNKWVTDILPQIEHPQYTRPFDWNGSTVPKVLISGDHKKVQYWRENWHHI
jgi:tRNA (guanine37-N1)-methyltransferase